MLYCNYLEAEEETMFFHEGDIAKRVPQVKQNTCSRDS